MDRRRFLHRASGLGLASVAQRLYGRATAGQASTEGRTKVIIDPERRLAKLDRNLFGSFLEHLGRAIYQGIYEPDSKLADDQGFRKDVMAEIRQVGVPIVRYPGGNFVSGYNWLDGVGPKAGRPRVLDRAWNTLEPNQFGPNEFIEWCRRAGTAPLLAVNLGSGTAENAAALVEYCNLEKGTRWSELRRQHGFEQPHGVKYWCLGNEMDGPWQIGHMPAREYGLKAADAARQMRRVDPEIELVACGSSGPLMPTYLDWDREVLEECYNDADAISLHRYFNNTSETGGDSSKFLALNLAMERQIEEVAAVCDLVRARRRSRKALWLSFDEWNVWYRARGGDGHRQEAPHLLEEVYNLEDALLVGGVLNSLVRHAGRVRVACLAQLVNVIAPIMTNSTGVLRQTIFYPYAWALEYRRGSVLDLGVEGPGFVVAGLDQVPYLDVAGTVEPESGKLCLTILNRDLVKSREVEFVWRGEPPKQVTACEVLTGNDLKASNTFDQPRRVVPQALNGPRAAARATFEVPAQSYTLIQWASG